ncbi:MAG: CDP-diacylglycerol--serine O-phosphatidyltransferase [Pseudomonadota bacterium]
MSSEPGAPRRRGIFLLPNLVTTLALFAGFFAIVAAIDGHFVRASVAIFVAMVLDGLDGRLARLTRTQSDFGKEYDSLSDMVSFGMAPAIVAYEWGVARLAEYSVAWGRIGWLVAFLFAVTAALRLARFNAAPSTLGKDWFQGLPSPSAAALVAAWIWLCADHGLSGFFSLSVMFLITAAAGLLMVSNLRYYSFKGISFGRRVSFAAMLLVPLILAAVSLHPPLMLFLLALSYAASGPILWLVRRQPQQLAFLDEEDHTA